MPGEHRAAAAPAAPAERAVPATLRVLGRSRARENGDICGEYAYVGPHQGRAAYQKPGTPMAIRYCQPARRWVIDREGLRDSDVCVAYAEESSGSLNPAHPELIWNVWDTLAQAHAPDPEVMAVDAPEAIALVGRDADRENCGANGEYELLDVRHGRPCYRHRCKDTLIRYYSPEDRWLVSAAAEAGNVCSAFADAAGSPHPGCPHLEWHFWEGQRGAFVLDPAARTLAAPALLHILGRSPQAENARICGTYYLAGVRDGRPVYVQPGTHAVVRYSAKHDWWLVDCDGLAEPSLMSRLYQWILSGDAAAAGDRCSAYAEAQGTQHPGHCALEWSVWDSGSGKHDFDPWVRSTTAPLVLRVAGRDPLRENGDINGDYALAGTHLGRPAYQKPGQSFALRYWPPMRRWVIDREGLRNADTCVAYADEAVEDTDHPASPGCVWHVFESSRGCHLADPRVSVTVPADAPRELPASVPAAAVAQLQARGQRPPPEFHSADAKRRRLCAQDISPELQWRPPAAGVGHGRSGPGWLGGLLGA